MCLYMYKVVTPTLSGVHWVHCSLEETVSEPGRPHTYVAVTGRKRTLFHPGQNWVFSVNRSIDPSCTCRQSGSHLWRSHPELHGHLCSDLCTKNCKWWSWPRPRGMILLIKQHERLEGPEKAWVRSSDVDDCRSSKVVSVYKLLGHVVSNFHETRAK